MNTLPTQQSSRKHVPYGRRALHTWYTYTVNMRRASDSVAAKPHMRVLGRRHIPSARDVVGGAPQAHPAVTQLLADCLHTVMPPLVGSTTLLLIAG